MFDNWSIHDLELILLTGFNNDEELKWQFTQMIFYKAN